MNNKKAFKKIRNETEIKKSEIEIKIIFLQKKSDFFQKKSCVLFFQKTSCAVVTNCMVFGLRDNNYEGIVENVIG